MTKEEIEKYGYYIQVDEDRNFYPFRMPNTIVTSTVYLIHPDGKREYIGYDSGAYYSDVSELEEEAIRRAQKYIEKEKSNKPDTKPLKTMPLPSFINKDWIGDEDDLQF